MGGGGDGPRAGGVENSWKPTTVRRADGSIGCGKGSLAVGAKAGAAIGRAATMGRTAALSWAATDVRFIGIRDKDFKGRSVEPIAGSRLAASELTNRCMLFDRGSGHDT